MNITWYGHSCFKIQGKDVTLITDPFGKDTGLKPPATSADIVTISHEHFDHNNRAAIKGEPFIIDGPGEYEIKKVVVRGVESMHNEEKGEKKTINTIFVIDMEDIRICHLGDLGEKSLSAEQLSAIGDVDVLFVPIGGVYTIGAKEAEAIIAQIEPRVVIPMHYRIKGVKGDLEKLEDAKVFCQDYSLNMKDAVSKVSFKKKDLPEEETQYILMDTGK
jgi:L-ascorbate metabolism protein UlaG (beta-lactamase superfamily)